ncbi:hypothetical protein [Erythrobacter sp. BLCC-B19]|uniref:hypothetical protein n=1 Tax=Erythrobacter sp. BLCC-B19 TaxID=3025315 RepID=UPI00235FD1C4|nr:hypothetical protein [Erythrobacter sp. BLCC-B19]WDA41378.1 hypothetical protein PS060_00805 [Erythrobacter sp. BLCC-B19]
MAHNALLHGRRANDLRFGSQSVCHGHVRKSDLSESYQNPNQAPAPSAFPAVGLVIIHIGSVYDFLCFWCLIAKRQLALGLELVATPGFSVHHYSVDHDRGRCPDPNVEDLMPIPSDIPFGQKALVAQIGSHAEAKLVALK